MPACLADRQAGRQAGRPTDNESQRSPASSRAAASITMGRTDGPTERPSDRQSVASLLAMASVQDLGDRRLALEPQSGGSGPASDPLCVIGTNTGDSHPGAAWRPWLKTILLHPQVEAGKLAGGQAGRHASKQASKRATEREEASHQTSR